VVEFQQQLLIEHQLEQLELELVLELEQQLKLLQPIVLLDQLVEHPVLILEQLDHLQLVVLLIHPSHRAFDLSIEVVLG